MLPQEEFHLRHCRFYLEKAIYLQSNNKRKIIYFTCKYTIQCNISLIFIFHINCNILVLFWNYGWYRCYCRHKNITIINRYPISMETWWRQKSTWSKRCVYICIHQDEKNSRNNTRKQPPSLSMYVIPWWISNIQVKH